MLFELLKDAALVTSAVRTWTKQRPRHEAIVTKIHIRRLLQPLHFPRGVVISQEKRTVVSELCTYCKIPASLPPRPHSAWGHYVEYLNGEKHGDTSSLVTK